MHKAEIAKFLQTEILCNAYDFALSTTTPFVMMGMVIVWSIELLKVTTKSMDNHLYYVIEHIDCVTLFHPAHL